jgi:hypothetical protein
VCRTVSQIIPQKANHIRIQMEDKVSLINAVSLCMMKNLTS